MKKYVLRPNLPDRINETLKNFDEFTRSLLYVRGIENESEALKFLNPSYINDLLEPYLLKDMDKAVERIIKAISNEEKIGIYSDYDCDGIPGAVALHDFFKSISFISFINYIPLRNEEGFGLNVSAIESLEKENVKLIITIDCGITDVKEVDLANKKGIDVIITDHHIPGSVLPKAYAIINPKQKDCSYPEKMLCGSGVIFKLIQALILKIKDDKKFNWKEGTEKWFLDMVGLATLSDMVSLLGENRVLSYYGMTVLRKSPRIGIIRLLSFLKIDQKNLNEDDVAFMITPRINAASRMGIPRDAFRLLSTKDEVEAGVLVEHLNNKNDERKGVVGSMIKEIKKRIENSNEEMKHVLVFGNPEWKPSLLGLVANSFSDEHQRPVFFWGREGSNGETVIKGSCRSGGKINVVKLMEKAKDIFIDFGGHFGAGGFSLLQENVFKLEEKLNSAFLEMENQEFSEEEILIDKKISIDDINWELYSKIEKFAPFGLDNPKPIFLLENLEIFSSKNFGKEQNHLELKFKNKVGKNITAMAFFKTKESFPIISSPRKINLVGFLEKSNFRNFPELRIRILDIF